MAKMNWPRANAQSRIKRYGYEERPSPAVLSRDYATEAEAQKLTPQIGTHQTPEYCENRIANMIQNYRKTPNATRTCLKTQTQGDGHRPSNQKIYRVGVNVSGRN